MYELQSDVPLADVVPGKRKGRRSKYPFESMRVDDMFFVPNKDKNTLAAYVWSVGTELGRKFASRLTYMKRVGDKWEPCDADDPKAVRGIGVWRTE